MHRPPRTRLRRSALALLAVSLLAAACSGGDDDDAAEDTTPTTEDGGSSDTTTADTDAPEEGGEADDDDVVEAAETWIADESGLGEDEQAQLRVADDGIRHQGPISHVTFEQVYDDVPVRGAAYIVHVLEDLSVQGATDDRVTGVEPAMSAEPTIDEATAVDNASKAVTGTVADGAEAELVWVQDGMELRLAFEVELSTSDPIGTWQVVLDGETGDVLDVNNALPGVRNGRELLTVAAAYRAVHGTGNAQQVGGDACELPAAPSACVFLPDPAFASGGDLDDRSDANDHLVGVELEGLDDEDSGELVGEHVDTVSIATESVDPDDDGRWGAGRGEDGFEAQMVYYWVDTVQRTMQDLGFDGVWDDGIDVNPLSDDPSAVDNAYYDGVARHIQMGQGTNGINAAEDASVIVHEYGHAVLDALAPDLLLTVDGAAIHEGFGDLFALFNTLDHRLDVANLECVAHWYISDCLREIDPETVFPDDLVNEPHADGDIYAGAVWQVFVRLLDAEGIAVEDCPGTTDCDELSRRFLTLLLGSTGYLTEDSGMPEAAEAILSANEVFFEDADRAVFEEVFADRGLVGGGTTPTGEGVAASIEILHTYRGDLSLAVGVVDAAGTVLCEVNLADPDESDAFDNFSGIVELAGTECDDPAFLPPSADAQWVLFAADTLRYDTGQVVDFTIYDGDVPYRAENVPQPIPDADPEGILIFVNGGSGTGDDGLGQVPAGDPFASVAISHPYRGDLYVAVGVVDSAGDILCSVDVSQTDAGDSAADLVGDVSIAGCAEYLPPSPEQAWYLLAVDGQPQDEGQIEAFSLTDAAGTTYAATDVPLPIPDDDLDNGALSLILDPTGSGTTGMPGSATAVLDLSITHPFRGDLSVGVLVFDAAGEVVCLDQVFEASSDGDDDIVGQAELPECTRYYPPGPDAEWYLVVIDTAAADEGTLDAATVTGPDGTVLSIPGPAAIPDNDPDGLVLPLV